MVQAAEAWKGEKMKNIIIGICSFVLLGLLLLTIYTIHGRSIRQAELDQALEDAMEQAVAFTGETHPDGPQNDQELTALFLEKFAAQIDSNLQVTVHILDIDQQKGLLSAEAVASFRHPTGKEGKVACRRTVIRESLVQEEEKEYCCIDYVVNGSSYKTYHVQKGSSLMIPGIPQCAGKKFLGWRERDGAEIVALAGRKTEKDCTFVAVFQ